MMIRRVVPVVLLLAASAAVAQSYPDKPIRLVVPFAAGGALDVVGRIVGQKLTESWGRQVVIDNRLGAVPATGRCAFCASCWP